MCVLLRQVDTANVVENSTGDDNFSAIFEPNTQCLQDGIFFLHTTREVFCRYNPQSGVGQSGKGLLVGVGLDEDITDGVPLSP
jgi:hypothetical protein